MVIRIYTSWLGLARLKTSVIIRTGLHCIQRLKFPQTFIASKLQWYKSWCWHQPKMCKLARSFEAYSVCSVPPPPSISETYFRATNDSGWKSWLAVDVQAGRPSAVGGSCGGRLKSYVDATADLRWYSSPQLLCKGSLCLLWSSLQEIRFHHVWTPDLPLTSLRQLVPELWECLVDMISAF